MYHARVAELADAHGSGPCGLTSVEVRIFSRAPQKRNRFDSAVSFFCYTEMIYISYQPFLLFLDRSGKISPLP